MTSHNGESLDGVAVKPDDDEDHTVMVDRADTCGAGTSGAATSDDDEDHTVMVNRAPTSDDDEDHTVMVDRARTSGAGTSGAATSDDDEDHTVMVDRAGIAGAGTSGAGTSGAGTSGAATSDDAGSDDDDDHTVMVDRAGTSSTATPDDDHTVVVGKKAAGAPAPMLAKGPRASRRRGMTPPPVPAGFAPRAVEAAGVGATEIYRPREIPAPLPTVPVILEGPTATREASATMPSVARHSRITARVAMVVFVASCVASVVGLTLIALAYI